MLLLAATLVNHGIAQDSTKTVLIKKMLELSGSAKLGLQVMDYMIANTKTTYAEVPDSFWEEFRKEVNVDQLNEMVIPLYDKYYTTEDIQGMIKFYESPVGQKMVKTTPMLMQESMAAGQKWGSELSDKIFQKLKQKGYIKST